MIISPMKVALIDSMGSDLSIVNAARVSFHKESEWDYTEGMPFGSFSLSAKDAKLVSYLAKHGHWTPFAHAFLSFRIKAPIFVARQLVKHQVGLAWNEVSRRYVDDEPEFFFPQAWRKKAENVKQGSSNETISGYTDDYDCYHNFDEVSQYAVERCVDLYAMMLEGGVAPEQARMVLPQNMHTEWIWSGSLAAFARVCKLRLDPHAQAETREIAEQINNAVPAAFEHSWKALLN